MDGVCDALALCPEGQEQVQNSVTWFVLPPWLCSAHRRESEHLQELLHHGDERDDNAFVRLQLRLPGQPQGAPELHPPAGSHESKLLRKQPPSQRPRDIDGHGRIDESSVVSSAEGPLRTPRSGTPKCWLCAAKLCAGPRRRRERRLAQRRAPRTIRERFAADDEVDLLPRSGTGTRRLPPRSPLNSGKVRGSSALLAALPSAAPMAGHMTHAWPSPWAHHQKNTLPVAVVQAVCEHA